MDTDTSSDLQLLEDWQAKDRDAGKRLVRRYHEPVAGFFRNAVGDDARGRLINATFQRFSRSHDAFRRDAGVRTHLFHAARHVLLEYLRKGAQGSPRPIDPATHSVGDISSEPRSQIVDQLRDTRPLLDGLRTLPLDLQQLLELHCWHGCTAGELGKIFEQPRAVIEQRLPEALAALHRALAKHGTNTESGAADDDQTLVEALRALGKLMVARPPG